MIFLSECVFDTFVSVLDTVRHQYVGNFAVSVLPSNRVVSKVRGFNYIVKLLFYRELAYWVRGTLIVVFPLESLSIGFPLRNHISMFDLVTCWFLVLKLQ